MKRVNPFYLATALLIFQGCLDLSLLDDMRPIDAGARQGGDSSQNGATDENSVSTDGDDPLPDPNDEAPPVLVLTSCGPLERNDQGICIAEGAGSASLRLETDERAEVELKSADDLRFGSLSGSWSLKHHLFVSGLTGGEQTTIEITVTDINDNGRTTEVALQPLDITPIAITEVLADPIGAEPDQEFVEIFNLGEESVDLSGWMIDDNGDQNGDLLPEGSVLQPGQVGIIVSSSYDEASGEDPSPLFGSAIFRLSSSIGSQGLKNSDAETVELYDAVGMQISEYHGQAGPPEEGVSVIRLAPELPDGDLLAFGRDPAGSSTPGQVPANHQ